MKKPVPSPAVLRAFASTIGYNTLLDGLFRSLHFLSMPLWSPAQKKSVESFVLQGLDGIPRTAGVPENLIAGEHNVVMLIETHLSPQSHGSTFCAAVLRKWRSDAVSSVLRARGVLQTGVTQYKQNRVDYEARTRADVAKHGLRDCALSSCDKTEKTVKEFAGCSGCRSVVYCCLEHQALDWRAHKKACIEEAARRAAEEVEQGAEKGEGGGAGAA